jgi:protein phosphatase/serine/threonine-protein phosphatase Stp1
MMPPRSFAATHRGTVRDHNEDNLVDAPALQLWAVADGAGGHEAGEVASAMLADALADLPLGLGPDEALTRIRRALMDVHQALRDEAERRNKSMIASTLVVLLLRGGHFAALWAGDSRIYLLRGGELSQITTDHSLVQALVDQGLISKAQAESHPQANVITRAIGAVDDTGELDKVLGATAPGDSFLLCSDGLTKVLDEATIAELLLAPDPATALVNATLEKGARDNVTAVVVQIPQDAPG